MSRYFHVLCAVAIAMCAARCGEVAAPQATPIAIPITADMPVQAAGRVATTRQAPTTPPTLSAARHDLSVDEALGGHTLERHVGRTDDQLRDRLRREPNISAASTYTDRETAEQVIGRAFEESAGVVDRWESRVGRRPNLVLDRTEPRAIGRSLRRSARTASACDHALVVMRWDERRSRAYVLTSYPECRP